jgi:hypothetical protein
MRRYTECSSTLAGCQCNPLYTSTKGIEGWISDPFDPGCSVAPYFSNERAFDEYCLVSSRKMGNDERLASRSRAGLTPACRLKSPAVRLRGSCRQGVPAPRIAVLCCPRAEVSSGSADQGIPLEMRKLSLIPAEAWRGVAHGSKAIKAARTSNVRIYR